MSHGTCAETAHVIGEAVDDLFNKLQGKSGDTGCACRGGLRRSTPGTDAVDSGLTSIPNSLNE